MKNIAFKRAKNAPAVKDALPPEFICEHADTDLFEPGFHKHEDGYEILAEEDFLIEFAKDDKYMSEYLEEKSKQAELELKAQSDAQQVRLVEERKAQIEYAEFQAWKAANKGKK